MSGRAIVHFFFCMLVGWSLYVWRNSSLNLNLKFKRWKMLQYLAKNYPQKVNKYQPASTHGPPMEVKLLFFNSVADKFYFCYSCIRKIIY